MEFDPRNVETFLTPYLREDRKKGFLEALRDFPPTKNFYQNVGDPEPLQGDCWAGVTVINFADSRRDRIKGLVLSNSCDIAEANPRPFPVGLNFAPLVPLARYEDTLQRAIGNRDRVANHIGDVRAQKVSSLFFLPDVGTLGGDSVAILDDVHTVPLDYFTRDSAKSRVFSLSDVGFWLFLFKLSFHFCRFHERVDRSPR